MSASSGTAQFPVSACTLGRVGCCVLVGTGHVALSWNWKGEGGRDGWMERWVDGESGGGENEEGGDEREMGGEGVDRGGRDGKRNREREKGDRVGKKGTAGGGRDVRRERREEGETGGGGKTNYYHKNCLSKHQIT